MPTNFTLKFEAFPLPDGALRYAYVPWDSESYGFPFYELKCEDLKPDVLAQNLRPWLFSLPTDGPCLVYSKLPIREIALSKVLTDHGFYYVETMLEIYLPFARLSPIVRRQSDLTRLRLAEESDLPQLIAIASTAFSADRLHLDPNLPPEKANRRYARWVESGFRSGEPVFIFEETRSGKQIGFFHIRETAPTTVDLSLAAVDGPYRGSGAGAMMYQALLTECQARGFQTAITRVSVNNIDVLNLFIRLGFAVRNALVVFHWFRSPRRE